MGQSWADVLSFHCDELSTFVLYLCSMACGVTLFIHARSDATRNGGVFA